MASQRQFCDLPIPWKSQLQIAAFPSHSLKRPFIGHAATIAAHAANMRKRRERVGIGTVGLSENGGWRQAPHQQQQQQQQLPPSDHCQQPSPTTRPPVSLLPCCLLPASRCNAASSSTFCPSRWAAAKIFCKNGGAQCTEGGREGRPRCLCPPPAGCCCIFAHGLVASIRCSGPMDCCPFMPSLPQLLLLRVFCYLRGSLSAHSGTFDAAKTL